MTDDQLDRFQAWLNDRRDREMDVDVPDEFSRYLWRLLDAYHDDEDWMMEER